MKKIFLFSLALISSNVFAVEVAQYGDGITFAKWTIAGRPVWTDAERDEIIAKGSASSMTIKSSDFTLVFPSSDEVALTTTTWPGTWDGRVLYYPNIRDEEVKRLLTDKDYLKEKALETYKKKCELQDFEAATGFDKTKEREKEESKLHFMKKLK